MEPWTTSARLKFRVGRLGGQNRSLPKPWAAVVTRLMPLLQHRAPQAKPMFNALLPAVHKLAPLLAGVGNPGIAADIFGASGDDELIRVGGGVRQLTHFWPPVTLYQTCTASATACSRRRAPFCAFRSSK
mmetsp:Transcript_76345/g.218731  ORF Transcript_76345/g.218731 Transcript_76345/m.218731 type:complete len:130 (-) Transcript_76345:1188-1577(-)